MAYTESKNETRIEKNTQDLKLATGVSFHAGNAIFLYNGLATSAIQGAFVGVANDNVDQTKGDIYVKIDSDQYAKFKTSLTASSDIGTLGYIDQTADNATVTNLAGIDVEQPYACVGLITAIKNGFAYIKLANYNLVTNSPIAVESVSVTPATFSVDEGSTQQLTVTVLPADATDKSVRYVSTNPSIATVSATGLVTGVLNGSCMIDIVTEDGHYETFSQVTVLPIEVTGVTLNKETTTIAVGATETLVATVAPTNATNKAVTWVSGTEGVATVSSTGVVTGVTAGSAVITVTTIDGSFTDTCTVTVPVHVESVSLNKDTTSLVVDATETLTETVLPSNATDKTVTWSSSDETKATVSSAGLVTGIATGEATITVTTTDGSFTDTCTVTVE